MRGERHRVGASLGMGWLHGPDGVTREFVERGRYEIEVAWQKAPAHAQLAPFYDPQMTRIRG